MSVTAYDPTRPNRAAIATINVKRFRVRSFIITGRRHAAGRVVCAALNCQAARMTDTDRPTTVRLRVIEQRIESLADSQGGDAILATESRIAVVDGGGSPLGSAAVLDALRALPPEADRAATLNAATAAIAGLGASVSLAIFSTHHSQVWAIGTVQVFWDRIRPRHTSRAVDTVAADYRAAVTATHLADHVTSEQLRLDDPASPGVHALLDRAHLLSNGDSPWSYGTVDGRPVPDRFVDTINVPAIVTEIVFATDGYPGGLRTLDTAENYLARLVESDPLGVQQARGVRGVPPDGDAYDDRAYVRFTLERAETDITE